MLQRQGKLDSMKSHLAKLAEVFSDITLWHFWVQNHPQTLSWLVRDHLVPLLSSGQWSYHVMSGAAVLEPASEEEGMSHQLNTYSAGYISIC